MDISALIEFTEFYQHLMEALYILKNYNPLINLLHFLMFGCSEFSLKSNFVSNIYLISFKPVKSENS